MTPEPTELEKQIKRNDSNRKIIDMLKEHKLASGLLILGLSATPFLFTFCQDEKGYIDIPKLLVISGILVGFPVGYLIYRIWKI